MRSTTTSRPSASRSSRSTWPRTTARPTSTWTSRSTPEQLAVVAGEVVGELRDHPLRPLPLAARGPAGAEPEARPALVEQLAQPLAVAVRRELGDLVDERADALRRGRRPAAAGLLQQPAQRAAVEGLHPGRRHRHLRLRRAQRAGRRGAGAGRTRTRDPRPARRRAPAGRARVPRTPVASRPSAGRRPRRAAPRPAPAASAPAAPRRGACSGRTARAVARRQTLVRAAGAVRSRPGRSPSSSPLVHRLDEVQERRRDLLLGLHRGDQQVPPGPGDRDVEQPQLVVQHRAALGRWRRRPARRGCRCARRGGRRAPARRAASRAAAGRATRPPGRRRRRPRPTPGRPRSARSPAPPSSPGRRAVGERVRRQLLALEVGRGTRPARRAAAGRRAGRRRRTARRRRRGRGRPARPPRRRASAVRRHDPAQPGGLPDRPQDGLGRGAPGAARRRRRATPRAPPTAPARPGGRPAPTPGSREASRAGSASASTSSSSLARVPPPASSSARSAWRSRRSATASAAPSGPVSRSTAISLVERGRVERAAQHQPDRPHRGLVAHRHLGGGDGDRHPGRDQRAPQRRGRAGRADDDRHPAPRRRRPSGASGAARRPPPRPPARPRRAPGPAMWRSVGGSGRDRSSGVPGCDGRALRWTTVPAEPMREATRCATSRSSGPCRHTVGRTTTAPGSPDAARNRSGASASSRGEAPRKTWVVASGSPASRRSRPPPQSCSSSRTEAAVSSCASSTTTSARRCDLLGEQLRVVREQPGRRVDDAGRVVGAGRRQRGDLEVLGEDVGGRHPVRPVLAAAEGGEVLGGEAALDRAHQQVAQLVAEAAQRAHVLGDRGGPLRRPAVAGDVAGEQVGEHPVLLRAGDQARRDVAVEHPRPAQQAERVGVRGAGQRLAHGAGEPGREPVAERGGGDAGGRQREDGVRRRRRPARPVRRPPRPASWSCRCRGRRGRSAAPRPGAGR